MPNIKTFDAGEQKFTPSEAGSAAFREAGGVAAHMANQAGESYRQAGRALAGAFQSIGSLQEKAQAHTDAMAEIDFQSQLTQAEIAAQGGVNTAGTPTDSDGKAIPDNPGRGVDKSLPSNANVPNPGQFATTASDTIEDHRDFMSDLIGKITGTGVSQKALDRMQLQAVMSDRRLALHANAVAGEVAFNHATHTTEQTINSTLGALGRGEVGLKDAIDHINGSFDAFQGTLTGEFAAKGGKMIDQKRDAAVGQAIRVSMQSDLAAGHPENAKRTLNDPQWDKYIGGDRFAFQKDIDAFQKAQLTEQTTARHFADQKQKDAALLRTDQYIQDASSENPKMKVSDIWTDPAYANRPDLRQQAVHVVETMRKAQTGDINVSPQLSHSTTLDLMKRMTAEDGDPAKIKDRQALDQAFIDQKLDRADYKFLQQEFGQLNKPGETQLSKTREDFFKHIDRTIDSRFALTGQRSALGDQNTYRARQDAIRQEQALRQKGQDPASLYDPTSPNYFGKPDNIMRYHTSMTDQLQFQKQIQTTGTFTDQTQKFGVGDKWGRQGKVEGLIIHHTGGGGDVNTVMSTLKERGLGAQYVIDREGNTHQLMPDNAVGRQIQNGSGKGEGLNNRNTVGVEVIAKNDKDVLPVQVEAAKKLAASLGQKYGFDPKTGTFGHGEVNPGHKEADEGMTITNAIRGTTQQAARPVTVSNANDYGKLAMGAQYLDPQGNLRVKGGR